MHGGFLVLGVGVLQAAVYCERGYRVLARLMARRVLACAGYDFDAYRWHSGQLSSWGSPLEDDWCDAGLSFLFCFALHMHMHRVLVMQCFICKGFVLCSALYAKIYFLCSALYAKCSCCVRLVVVYMHRVLIMYYFVYKVSLIHVTACHGVRVDGAVRQARNEGHSIAQELLHAHMVLIGQGLCQCHPGVQ